MKLILIRHTSVDVAKGVCYGATDVALAPSFPREAEEVKKKLAGYHFDMVFTSPLSRCEKLADFCGFPDAVRDDRLKEMNFGEWEMQPFDSIKDVRLQEWYDDYINVRPTGGESVVDQRKRLKDFVEYLKERSGIDTVAIFTHGGILMNALVEYGGKNYRDVYSSIPPYGSIIKVSIPG